MILVLQTERCKGCKLCQEDDLVKFWCAATAKPISPNVVRSGERAEWCPLKEVPSKISNDWKDGKYQRGYVDGWNDCIENLFVKN